MIDRPAVRMRIAKVFLVHPVAVLLGPRQCGKTTLARELASQESSTYFDLDHPRDLARLEQPLQALESLRGLVVIDEFQRRPDLFNLLRVLVDRPENPAQFLVLGSASLDLVKGVSESLAGRAGFVDLSGFDLLEVGPRNMDHLWVRGGFPRSFLAPDRDASLAWREGFVRTFLERDLPQLGISIPSETMRRCWTMIAHYHGQTWNSAELARSLGASQNTARRYLEVLSGAYMVRVLRPWFINSMKRQRKAPKIYVRDSGLLHTLLGIDSLHDLRGHPKLGASWEGFAIEQILARFPTRDAYYWAAHTGAELDLLLFWNGRRIGFELKYRDAPRTTRSMRVVLEDLQLDHLYVIYPGTESYPLDGRISVCPARSLDAIELSPGG
jgi:uncharacterized protein